MLEQCLQSRIWFFNHSR